jgi:nitroreductase
MDLETAIRRRHMVRSFRTDPVDDTLIDDLLDLSRRAPSAGNTSAVEFVVASTPEAVSRYWDITLPPERRAGFSFPGLLLAPVLVILLTRPDAYARRYRESDKTHTTLGESTASWGVPYWWVDAGAVAQNLLLAAQARGLGACLFGLFEHEAAVLAAFAVPTDRRAVATIAMGYPTQDPGRPGSSAGRTRPDLAEIIHREHWHQAPRER